MSFLDNLNWRFAVKKFAKGKRVSPGKLEKILLAIRLAPSSLGLQPYHIFVVSDQKLKEKMRGRSLDQAQVSDCGDLLIFCSRIDLENIIDRYLALSQAVRGYTDVQIKKRRESLLAEFAEKTEAEKWQWAEQQTFIALGFALAACAELKVDSCPMGGFNSREIDKILDLPGFMRSTVFLAAGVRDQQLQKKVRFSRDDLFTFV